MLPAKSELENKTERRYAKYVNTNPGSDTRGACFAAGINIHIRRTAGDSNGGNSGS